MGQSGSSARRRRDDQRHHSNPPPQPHPHPHPHPNPYYYSSYAPSVRHYNPFMSRSGYPGYFVAGNGAGPWRQPYYVPAAPHPPPPPPPYVERQSAKTVKNDVHVHRDTIRISMDERGNDQYLVSFVYDAVVDGSVTIFYFAKEGADCCFSSIYPDMHAPVTIPFQKGMRQNFSQPSGTGIDLGFFELEDLSKPQPGDVFPLVIYAEACQMRLQSQEGIDQTKAASCAQITQAVIEKNSDGAFMVKVVKQILWVDGERYELQEIFGLEGSGEAGIDGGDDNDDMGKECVICMSEPRDTAVFPCRHMCMCSECAKALRLQSNKCPICRQPVEKLMEIKVKGANH